MRSAVEEITAAGWTDGVGLIVFEGPDEYLYGEETALLETIDGRLPFPRVSPAVPPGRRRGGRGRRRTYPARGSAAHVEMAGADGESTAPPALVDNVETLANVPASSPRRRRGFEREGTEKSPGTIVCTVTGSVAAPRRGRGRSAPRCARSSTTVGGPIAAT